MVAGITLRQLAIGLLVLIVLGAIRLPLESHLRERLVDSKFRESEIDFALRDDLGANLMAAALGGSRSLVATIIDFEAFDHWQRNDYDRVDLAYRWIHKLQPDSYYYWDWAAWQAAYNAASHDDPRNHEDGDKQEYDEWVARGAEILKDGLKRLPDDYRLYGSLGELYRSRTRPPDPCQAAKYYKLAMESPDSKEYYRRFYGYELAKCPGNEQEAYALLREIYEVEGLRYPTLLKLLQNLEVTLSLPESERIVW